MTGSRSPRSKKTYLTLISGPPFGHTTPLQTRACVCVCVFVFYFIILKVRLSIPLQMIIRHIRLQLSLCLLLRQMSCITYLPTASQCILLQTIIHWLCRWTLYTSYIIIYSIYLSIIIPFQIFSDKSLFKSNAYGVYNVMYRLG